MNLEKIMNDLEKRIQANGVSSGSAGSTGIHRRSLQ
jgi:hypothetical protein